MSEPWFKKSGNGPILLHNIVPVLPAEKKDAKIYIAPGSLNVDNTKIVQRSAHDLSHTCWKTALTTALCLSGKWLINEKRSPLLGFSLENGSGARRLLVNTLTISLWSVSGRHDSPYFHIYMKNMEKAVQSLVPAVCWWHPTRLLFKLSQGALLSFSQAPVLSNILTPAPRIHIQHSQWYYNSSTHGEPKASQSLTN